MKKLLVLQLRFLIPILVFFLFMASITFAIINHVQNHKEEKILMLEENLKLRMYGLQNELNDIYALKLNDLIKRRISEFCLDPQISILVLIDENDDILYSNFGEYIGASYNKLKEIESSKAKQIINKNNGQLLYVDNDKFVAYMNINMDVLEGEIRRAKQGFIYFQYDFRSLLDKAMQSAYIDAVSYLISGIAFALMLSYILFRLITKPVNELTLKMKEFAGGNLSARVKLESSNEIGMLAEGFNRMADEMEKKTLSLNLLQFIVERSSDAFYVIREDASFEFVNASASRDLGYTKEEFATFKVFDIDKNFTEDMWLQHWTDIKDNHNYTFETVQLAKNGDKIPVEIAVNYVKFAGIEYHCAVVRNITERKNAENELLLAKSKAEESEKLKTAFLQNMSHEIRTPLNGIIGFSNLLQDRNINTEEIFDYTNIIKQSGTRLLEIVNNVLDISKIETGQVQVVNKEFSVNTILANAYSFFSPMAQSKNIGLNYIDYPENVIINSDDAKLNQILTNLINNAIKFTHRGSVSFGFEIKEDNIVFFVKDTGTGISQNDYNKIFDRFTQIDLKITRGYEGAGLGLAISKGLVELLGGKIWLESQVNVGTTFYFAIPYLPSKSQELKSNPDISLSKKESKGTILIVEDDLTSSMFLNQVLMMSGYNVLMEQNGKEAIELIESNDDINLVLMDIRMPVMNGIEATKYIKSIKPDLPIIAQTAYAFSEEKDLILSIGCTDYIAKPVSAEKLLKLIDQHLVNANKI